MIIRNASLCIVWLHSTVITYINPSFFWGILNTHELFLTKLYSYNKLFNAPKSYNQHENCEYFWIIYTLSEKMLVNKCNTK